MNKLLLIMMPFFFLVLTTSCKDDDDNDDMPAAMNIVETAQATGDLSSLVEALTAADLVTALQGSGPFTVFAPTNAAFQALLDSNTDWNSISDIPTDVLSMVLQFHVINGEVRAADLTDTYVNTLAVGPNNEPLSLQIAVSGPTFNGSTAPVTTDIETTNGVVHVVDEVMLPRSIPAFALTNPAFSSLVAALTDARHANTTPPVNYVGLLSGDGPFTVFAPTNDAFQALLDSNNDWNSLADIDIATLQAVLNYHVFDGGNVQSDELTVGQEIPMFSGDILTVAGATQLSTATQTGATAVNIIITDVQGTNGVVHAIDQVLLP